MMASNDLMECGVCSEGFNEVEHKPIILPCSHSFCVCCVDGIIQYESQLCPLCRKKFQASSSEDLLINRGLLDLVKYCRQLETRQSKPSMSYAGQSKPSMSYEGWRVSHRDSVAKILETRQKVEKLIQVDDNMIDEVQNINQELKVMVKDNEKLVQKFKDHKEKLQNHLTDVEEKEKVIKKTQIKLEEATSFATAGPFMDEISIAMEALQGTLSEMKLVMEANRTLLANGRKKNKMSRRKLGCIKEILDSAEAEEEDGSLVSVPVGGAVGGSVKDLLFLTYKYLESLGIHRTYMDLSARGKPLGRIVITYVNEEEYKDYVANHMSLCFGALGPSFTNSNALQLKNAFKSKECLVFGDYERNNGSGGKPVCGSQWDNINLNSNYFYSSHSFAIVPHTYKEETASQFCIMTRRSDHNCFGYISEGGNILQSVAQKFENIREVKISGCGILIN